MNTRPAIVGILNLTEDSFSDGGLYLEPGAAIARARALRLAGADFLDLGAASSHPDARPVSGPEEIRRLEPVVEALRAERVPLSIDTWQPEVQEFALAREVAILNDIRGFPDAALYPALARARCKLVVMFSLASGERATRDFSEPTAVFERIIDFFETRTQALVAAGVARERIVLDPGMGFFLGSNPETSLHVLRNLNALRTRFARPLFVSVSRKSFLGTITGKQVAERQAATLAAELHAARQGVAYLRTHAVDALRDALLVQEQLEKG